MLSTCKAARQKHYTEASSANYAQTKTVFDTTLLALVSFSSQCATVDIGFYFDRKERNRQLDINIGVAYFDSFSF